MISTNQNAILNISCSVIVFSNSERGKDMALIHSLSSKIVKLILDEYGGSACYSRNNQFRGSLVYNNRTNPGVILSIDIKYEKQNGSNYIEVSLTDNRGRITQTDCYEILFNTDLYKKSSKKTGKDTEYIDEKIGYVGPNKQKSRKELEQQIKQLQEQNNMLSDAYSKVLNNSEHDFLNSKSYIEMQEQIDFFKSLNKMNEIALAKAESRVLKSTAEIQQIYADNKRFLEHEEDNGYFIGITENWHDAWEFEKLQQEINDLKGQIRANAIFLSQRECEIEKLHAKVASLMKEFQDSKVADINTNEVICLNRSNETEEGKYRESQGKRRGRKPAMSNETKQTILELHRKGKKIRDIAEQTGVSIGWVHETIKRNTEHN